jgi:hypothetical protein
MGMTRPSDPVGPIERRCAMPGHDQGTQRTPQAAGAGSNLSRTAGSDDDNMDAPGTAGGFDPGTGGTGQTGTELDQAGGGATSGGDSALSGAGGQGGMGSGQGGMDYGQAGAGSAADQAATGSTGTDYGGTGVPPMPDRPEDGDGSSQWSEGSEGEAR